MRERIRNPIKNLRKIIDSGKAELERFRVKQPRKLDWQKPFRLLGRKKLIGVRLQGLAMTQFSQEMLNTLLGLPVKLRFAFMGKKMSRIFSDDTKFFDSSVSRSDAKLLAQFANQRTPLINHPSITNAVKAIQELNPLREGEKVDVRGLRYENISEENLARWEREFHSAKLHDFLPATKLREILPKLKEALDLLEPFYFLAVKRKIQLTKKKYRELTGKQIIEQKIKDLDVFIENFYNFKQMVDRVLSLDFPEVREKAK